MNPFNIAKNSWEPGDTREVEQQRLRTADVRQDGCTIVGCTAMGDAVRAAFAKTA